jgi:outer membrane protein assembly factor BamB
MGFLKKSITYFLLAILISGCAPSLIKIKHSNDEDPYFQYGKYPHREFHYKYPISTTLTEKWESSISGGFSNSSVTIYDSAVFINDLSGRIYCFSLPSGKKLGQLKFKGSVFTTPIFHNFLIIFAVVSDNENLSTLYYYDTEKGKEIFSFEIAGRVTNQLLKTDEGIIVLSENGYLFLLDFMGTQIWQYDANSLCLSSPASNGEVVAFGNDAGEIICVNALNGSLIFRKKIADSFLNGAVINGRELYFGSDDGKLYSVDLESGNINWLFQTNSKIKMEAVVTEKEVFIGNLKGEFYKLSRSDGTQIWKLNTKGLLNITPLLSENLVILPDANKQVQFILRDDGSIVSSISLEGRLKLSPVIKNNLLFLGYENGNLIAYELTP